MDGFFHMCHKEFMLIIDWLIKNMTLLAIIFSLYIHWNNSILNFNGKFYKNRKKIFFTLKSFFDYHPVESACKNIPHPPIDVSNIQQELSILTQDAKSIFPPRVYYKIKKLEELINNVVRNMDILVSTFASERSSLAENFELIRKAIYKNEEVSAYYWNVFYIEEKILRITTMFSCWVFWWDYKIEPLIKLFKVRSDLEEIYLLLKTYKKMCNGNKSHQFYRGSLHSKIRRLFKENYSKHFMSLEEKLVQLESSMVSCEETLNYFYDEFSPQIYKAIKKRVSIFSRLLLFRDFKRLKCLLFCRNFS